MKLGMFPQPGLPLTQDCVPHSPQEQMCPRSWLEPPPSLWCPQYWQTLFLKHVRRGQEVRRYWTWYRWELSCAPKNPTVSLWQGVCAFEGRSFQYLYHSFNQLSSMIVSSRFPHVKPIRHKRSTCTAGYFTAGTLGQVVQ